MFPTAANSSGIIAVGISAITAARRFFTLPSNSAESGSTSRIPNLNGCASVIALGKKHTGIGSDGTE